MLASLFHTMRLHTCSMLMMWMGILVANGQATLKLELPQGQSLKAGQLPTIACEANGWNPADASGKFSPCGRFWCLPLPASWKPGGTSLAYKLTLGSWETVQTTASGADVENQQLPAAYWSRTDTVTLVVAAFKQGVAKPKRSTASKQVRTIGPVYLPSLKRNTYLAIWLPKAFSKGKRYHVIYAHDGQNLFNDSTSFSGEWGLDEVMEQREREGKPIAIIVGMYNSPDRMAELSPFPNAKYGGGKGDLYFQDWLSTIKPMVDSLYPTDASPRSTWLLGSSLGGLMNAWALQDSRWSGHFGGGLVFSPALWFNPEVLKASTSRSKPKPVAKANRKRLYVYAGGAEDSSMVPLAQQYAQQQEQRGHQVKVCINHAGRHHEHEWRQQLPAALDWLLKP